jgi:hypothetical protein
MSGTVKLAARVDAHRAAGINMPPQSFPRGESD